MARIPIPQLSLGSVQQAPTPTYASPEVFGADNARQMQAAGGDIINLSVKAGGILNEERRQQERQDIAAATAGFDFSKAYAEERQSAPPGGGDFRDKVLARYDDETGRYLDQIKSSYIRNEVRAQLQSRRAQVAATATEFGLRSQQIDGRRLAGEALQTVENRVRTDPGQYDIALADGLAVIDSRAGIPADVREAMKRQFRGNLALRRFESMASRAQTAGEMEAVAAELNNPKWDTEFKPQDKDRDRLLDQLKTQAKSFGAQARAEARAGLAGLTDRNRAGDVIAEPELAEVRKRVIASGDPGLTWHFAEIERQQQVYRTNRGMPPSFYREKITTGRAAGIAGLPEPVRDGIAAGVAATNGDISPEYLSRMVRREYGAFLTTGDYGRQTTILGPDGKPTSDATGVAQFISTTFVKVLRTHGDALGVNVRNMSDADILKLRADPKISIAAAALHAADNTRYLQNVLKRPITDTDRDLAHFLGLGGAEKFLTALADPKNTARPASDFVDSKAVAANKAVFFDDKGRALTAAQLYGKFAVGQGRVDHAEIQAYERLARDQQQGLREDPMTYLMKTGRYNVQPLSDEASYAQRGNLVRAASSYFEVPLMKPLTKDEVESMTRVVKEGSADDKLKVMTQLQAMGPDVAKAAYLQLGEKDGVFALAAGLAYERGQFSTAADIVRGETRMKQNKDIEAAIGLSSADLLGEYNRIVGRALMGVSAADAAAIRQAAVAHYVETHVARGNTKVGKFDKEAFAASVNAVVGARVEEVNGAPTILPPGMNGAQFDKALDKMTALDYVRMSVDGSPPRFGNGAPIEPGEIAREAQFESIGGNQYTLKMADGRFAVTGQVRDGQAVKYVMRADPNFFKEVLARPVAVPTGRLPPMAPNAPGGPAKPRVIQ